jgi:hypothetical protein
MGAALERLSPTGRARRPEGTLPRPPVPILRRTSREARTKFPPLPDLPPLALARPRGFSLDDLFVGHRISDSAYFDASESLSGLLPTSCLTVNQKHEVIDLDSLKTKVRI